MNRLKITIIQTELLWENIKGNIESFDKKLNSIDYSTDLIILPEMFLTGFSMNPEKLALNMSSEPLEWIREKAAQKNSDIVGSLIIKEKEKYFNRLLWVKPGGETFFYDKKHLFRMTGEHLVFSSGKERLTVELNGWKIRPFICYDLRFPAWTRNLRNDFDVLLFVANWPAKRAHHWKILLKARAIENQCYAIGVNRIGVDGNSIDYSGDSMIVDPTGNSVFNCENKESISSVEISMKELEMYRKDFPVWKDADKYELLF